MNKPVADGQEPYRNVWGLDVLISNGGFGLGTFYRRALTPDLSGVLSFSIAESKDDREVEQFDFYGQPYTPGKLNRFLVMPLTLGIQYRLFREDIVETFRPYVNIGAGPTMIYVMPYADVTSVDGQIQSANQVDFFKAIGRGHPRYTATAFVGVGANFGGDQSSIFGVNFRYYFTYLLSGKIPSLYNTVSGAVSGYMNSFGGFFITLNIGMGY
ncbi:MAG TPA: hypothetical protein VF889_01995 [Bacteroidota bacterium]